MVYYCSLDWIVLMEKESFKRLIEEERDGFVIPAQMKQSWAADLAILKDIDTICKCNGITYFADWGSLLGAVRHGGMIPWDDDLDIVMKRADYLRFLGAVEGDISGKLQVLTYRNQRPDNWMFMGKVVRKNRICFEPEHLRENYNFPYVASVDVFVLDYLYMDDASEQRRRDICLYLLGVANSIKDGTLKGNQIRNNLQYIRKKWQIDLPYIDNAIEMARFLYGKIEELFAAVSENESAYLCQLFPWGLKGTANIYPKAYYEKAIKLPFEDTMIPVPLAFNEMLRLRYGEYWRLIKGGGAHEYPNFEIQKKDFEAEAGIQLPKYTVSKDVLLKKYDTNLVSDTIALTFKQMLSMGSEALVVPESVEQTVEMQQLAIEMGNVIEEVKGEEQPSVRYLEQYCELLYELYELVETQSDTKRKRMIECYSQLQECLYQFRECLQDTILSVTNIVIFTVYKREIEAVAELKHLLTEYAKSNNRKISVQVVVLDYYAKDYDGTLVEYWSDIDDFLQCFGVISQEQMPMERLAFLYPDIVFSTNGYDQWNENVSVHPLYYSTQLRKCTENFVYYDTLAKTDFERQDEKSFHNLKYRLCCPGVMEADYVIVNSETLKERYIEKLTEIVGQTVRDGQITSEEKEQLAEYWRKRIIAKKELGSDNALKKDAGNDSATVISSFIRKKLLYCLSVGALLERGTEALRKIKSNLNTLKENTKIDFCVTVFPDLTEEIIAISPEIFGELFSLLDENKVSLLRSSDVNLYEITAYYGDGCPYMVRMQSLGKPVMIQNYEL